MAKKIRMPKLDLQPGYTFSTVLPNGNLIETGCKVIEAPDEFGAFVAIDSEGVECTFSTSMVSNIWNINGEMVK